MENVLSKISAYHILNYLIPGGVFAVLVEEFTHFSFLQKDLLSGIIYYYFLGLVISRVGSLALQPSLEKIGFLQFESYEDFLKTSKKDVKLNELSASNNMYRTFSSIFISIAFLRLLEFATEYFHIPENVIEVVSIVFLLGLFLFSYRKQSNYITKRIDKFKENN